MERRKQKGESPPAPDERRGGSVDRSIGRSIDRAKDRRLFLALEPPGNVSRDLCLYRRRLFGALEAPSALAFPECIALAFALGSGRVVLASEPPRRDPIIGRAWEGIEGRFGSGPVIARGGSLFLEVEGPVQTLAAAAASLMDSLGLRADPGPPFPPALGFFLCGNLGSRAEGALSLAASAGPPELSFLDSSLILMAWEAGEDPLSALRWRELGRAGRWTGPSRGREY